jgi:hypothetical protein
MNGKLREKSKESTGFFFTKRLSNLPNKFNSNKKNIRNMEETRKE